ncbi:CxC2 domain-containing protein, partial [Favolaschia claudopus]
YFAQVISTSANGRSVSAISRTVHVDAPQLEFSQEDLLTNAAVESLDFSYDLGDSTLVGEVQESQPDGILLTAKRKVYENSDYPMLTWANHQDEYLAEMLRLEGRGYPSFHSACKGCGAGDPLFRCEHQMC